MDNRIQSESYNDSFSVGASIDEQISRRLPGSAQAGALFSFGVIALIYLGRLIQGIDLYSGLLVSELLLVGLPAVLILIIGRYDVAHTLRLNRIKLKSVVAIVFMMPFAMLTAGLLNFPVLLLTQYIFGRSVVNNPPVADSITTLVISIIVIAGSAGVCEELMFRGVILKGLEGLGKWGALVLSSVLFGLIHLDFQKFVGTFVLGMLIGFLVIRSNSIYAGMIAHFFNNATSVVVSYISSKFNVAGVQNNGADMNAIQLPDLKDIADGQIVAVIIGIIIGIGVVITVTGGMTALFLYLFIRTTRTSVAVDSTEIGAKQLYSQNRSVTAAQPFSIKKFAWAMPGIVLVAIAYVVIALRLSGSTGELVRLLSWVIGI